jgi:hypothetical protein
MCPLDAPIPLIFCASLFLRRKPANQSRFPPDVAAEIRALQKGSHPFFKRGHGRETRTSCRCGINCTREKCNDASFRAVLHPLAPWCY